MGPKPANNTKQDKFRCNALLAIVLAGCGPMGPGALQRIMSHFEELLLSGCQAVY